IAVTMIGLGFYALHNTLQTNATQMTPAARGTAVALFSSAIYLGQTGGVAAGAFIFDRFGGAPLFVATAIVLPTLAFWFAWKLRRRPWEDKLTEGCRPSSSSLSPEFTPVHARRVRSPRGRAARPGLAGCRRASSSGAAGAFRGPGPQACDRSAPAPY